MGARSGARHGCPGRSQEGAISGDRCNVRSVRRMENAMSEVSDVRFTPASAIDQRSGVLGWMTFIVGEGLRIDNVAVRRTRDGRIALSFPARRSRDGRQHPLVHPVDDRSRRRLEREILARLDLEAMT